MAIEWGYRDTETGEFFAGNSQFQDYMNNQRAQGWGQQPQQQTQQQSQQTQQSAKVSPTGAYIQNPGTTSQNMQQLYYQLNPQVQPQPVAYWNPNTNVVYAGGMPTPQPQVYSVGYSYQPGYQTNPNLIPDMSTGQLVGAPVNQFGPSAATTPPMFSDAVPQQNTPVEDNTQNNTEDNTQDNTLTTPYEGSAVQERDQADAANVEGIESQIASRIIVPSEYQYNEAVRRGALVGEQFTNYNDFILWWNSASPEERSRVEAMMPSRQPYNRPVFDRGVVSA